MKALTPRGFKDVIKNKKKEVFYVETQKTQLCRSIGKMLGPPDC